MYNVNRAGISAQLALLPELADSLSGAAAGWGGTVNEGLAQERALHLAAEVVTDVGHALIDGFVMRDAGSYEDIIEIIAGEGVVGTDTALALRKLALLRKPLVQEYDKWPRRELHPLTGSLPGVLSDFAAQVEAYLRQELDG